MKIHSVQLPMDLLWVMLTDYLQHFIAVIQITMIHVTHENFLWTLSVKLL